MYTLPDQNLTSYVVDGMYIVQSMKESSFHIFGDYAKIFQISLLHLLRENTSIKTLCVVFDRYDNHHSIKTSGRERRERDDALATHSILAECKAPNYRTFLKKTLKINLG